MIKRLFALCAAVLLLISGMALAQSVSARLGVSIIEDGAFSGDVSISTITLDEDLRYIGSDAFKDCTGLLTVYCFSDDAEISDTAFEGVTNAVIYCDVGSTMDTYAHSKGLTVKYLNAFETACDTEENACVLLPITWTVVNPMPGRDIESSFLYEVYEEGSQTPVYVSEPTQSTEFSYTPLSGGTYYVDITMTNALTVTRLGSSKVKVADKLTMGSYDGEAIEWKVLAVKGNKALLISDRILKNNSYFNPYWIKYKYTYWAKSYIGSASSVNYRGSAPESSATRITGISPTHIPLSDGSWGKESDLYSVHCRYWCNTTFYNSAFSTSEKNRILTVTNKNNDSPAGVDGGPDTEDRVFFLSYEEVLEYMPNKSDRKCGMSKAASKEKNSNDTYNWWLRTPGKYRVNAMYVYGSNGTISTSGSDVGHKSVGYRPCVWIKIGG